MRMFHVKKFFGLPFFQVLTATFMKCLNKREGSNVSCTETSVQKKDNATAGSQLEVCKEATLGCKGDAEHFGSQKKNGAIQKEIPKKSNNTRLGITFQTKTLTKNNTSNSMKVVNKHAAKAKCAPSSNKAVNSSARLDTVASNSDAIDVIEIDDDEDDDETDKKNTDKNNLKTQDLSKAQTLKNKQTKTEQDNEDDMCDSTAKEEIDYFDMDCEEIDESDREDIDDETETVEVSKANETKPTDTVKDSSQSGWVDEMDITVISDDEDDSNDKSKVSTKSVSKSTEITSKNTSSALKSPTLCMNKSKLEELVKKSKTPVKPVKSIKSNSEINDVSVNNSDHQDHDEESGSKENGRISCDEKKETDVVEGNRNCRKRKDTESENIPESSIESGSITAQALGLVPAHCPVETAVSVKSELNHHAAHDQDVNAVVTDTSPTSFSSTKHVSDRDILILLDIFM